MSLLASETLVSKLAAHDVGEDLPSTELQKALKIPRFLVYLVGIVIAEEEYQERQRTQRQQRFLDLQNQYWEHTTKNNSEATLSRTYQLTERLSPSSEQQSIVFRDLQKERKRQESLAEEALIDLWNEEAAVPNGTLRKAPKKRKKKKAQRASEKVCSFEKVVEEKGSSRLDTLEGIIQKTLLNSSNETAEEGGAWVAVKRKEQAKILPYQSSTEERVMERKKDATTGLDLRMDPEDLEHPQSNPPGLPIRPIVSDACEPKEDIDSHTKLDETIRASHSVSIPLTPNHVGSNQESKAGSDLLSTPDAKDTNCAQRIHALEQELLDAHQQMEKEKLEHAKVLRNEKDRYESLIQALQLRLYISENKLRTHEEALENHLQAVATIRSNGTAKKSQRGSDEILPSSPTLISRALEKNHEKKISLRTHTT